MGLFSADGKRVGQRDKMAEADDTMPSCRDFENERRAGGGIA